MRQFYEAFPIFATLSQKLSWSHYLQIIPLEGADARRFYLEEAESEKWSVRELRRAIETKYYERLLHTQEAKALRGMDDVEEARSLVVRKAQTDDT